MQTQKIALLVAPLIMLSLSSVNAADRCPSKLTCIVKETTNTTTNTTDGKETTMYLTTCTVNEYQNSFVPQQTMGYKTPKW